MGKWAQIIQKLKTLLESEVCLEDTWISFLERTEDNAIYNMELCPRLKKIEEEQPWWCGTLPLSGRYSGSSAESSTTTSYTCSEYRYNYDDMASSRNSDTYTSPAYSTMPSNIYHNNS